MSKFENSPESNPYTREAMSLVGLKWNVFEMRVGAHRQNRILIEDMRQVKRSTASRILGLELPSETKRLRKQVVPVKSERIILEPDRAIDKDVRRLIVRTPVRDDLASSKVELQDATFFELITDANKRERFLLNNEGLWRYYNAADIESIDGSSFRTRRENAPEPTDRLEQLSRYVSTFSYGLQTSYDVEL